MLFAAAPLTALAAMTYDWLPTECAPAACPMFLVKGRLLFAGGGGIPIPDQRHVSNGWGRRGSTHIVGPAKKPAPAQLALAWFSHTENKFFAGVFPLPERAIAELMATPIADTHAGNSSFNRIIVGMAPGGLVSVWAGATIEALEVATFEAPEVDLPWETVLKNPDITREEYVQAVLTQKLGAEGLEQLRRQGVPVGLFQGYRKQYRWRPWVTGAGTPDRLQIRSFNGENAVILPTGPIVPRELRPVPSQILLDWVAPGGERILAEITFDEGEVFEAFSSLTQGSDVQLGLRIETALHGVGASLHTERSGFPLKKIAVRQGRR
jgi:hypothetical protein